MGIRPLKVTSSQTSTERIWTKDFILICLANFFIFFGFQMTLPTLPLFVEHLGGNDQLIGWVVGIFTLSALIIRPYSGHLLESKGRAFVYITGLFIFIISVGSYIFAASFIFLFIMRFIQGIGWGLSTTASGTIAADIVPASRRGEGLGYYGLSGNIALALGPSLGLILVDWVNFGQLFFICAFMGVISLVLAIPIRYVKPEQGKVATKPRWDFYEKSALKPSILLFFITFTFGAIPSFLPLYTNEKEIEGIQVYFVIYALSLMLTRTFAGMVYDHKGHRAVFLPGAILIIIAMLLLYWLPNSYALYSAAFLYGFGFGIIQPGMQAWAIDSADKRRRGMATATFFSCFDLGIGLGSVVFGQIAHIFNYQTIFLVSAGSVMLSILYYITILVGEMKEKKMPG